MILDALDLVIRHARVATAADTFESEIGIKDGVIVMLGKNLPKATKEIDAAGRVVWKVGNDDFPAEKPFADPCGGQRLPNGNTVIASYGSQGDIKVFEITRDKKIVWKYTGPHRAHEIQVLTTNGKPIEGKPLK